MTYKPTQPTKGDHYAWITPEGDFWKAHHYGHVELAEFIFETIYGVDPDCEEMCDVTSLAESKGWIKIGNSGVWDGEGITKARCFLIACKKPTQAQKDTVELWCIENRYPLNSLTVFEGWY